MKIKVLIIGLGNIGMMYDIKNKNAKLTHTKSFFANSKFNLIGGVDNSSIKLKIFENKYKIKGYKSVHEALKYLIPDLIVVSTNTDFHLKTIKEIFKSKFKNKVIFCEKPGGKSLREINEINKICKFNNCKIFFNYMRISQKSTRILFKYLNNIKGYIKGVAYYRNSLLNDASHFINLFQFIFGKVIKIKKNGSIKKDKDEINFTLYFKKAEIQFISINFIKFRHSRFEFIHQKGRLMYNSGHNCFKIYKTKINSLYKNYHLDSKPHKIIDLNIKEIQKECVSELYKMFNKKRYYLCDIVGGINTMKTINEIKT